MKKIILMLVMITSIFLSSCHVSNKTTTYKYKWEHKDSINVFASLENELIIYDNSINIYEQKIIADMFDVYRKEFGKIVLYNSFGYNPPNQLILGRVLPNTENRFDTIGYIYKLGYGKWSYKVDHETRNCEHEVYMYVPAKLEQDSTIFLYGDNIRTLKYSEFDFNSVIREETNLKWATFAPQK